MVLVIIRYMAGSTLCALGAFYVEGAPLIQAVAVPLYTVQQCCNKFTFHFKRLSSGSGFHSHLTYRPVGLWSPHFFQGHSGTKDKRVRRFKAYAGIEGLWSPLMVNMPQ
jgi:hypothetical protein